ncbi:interleukin-1 receptor-associated kinase-like 2 isoform X2 [Heterocephalus glaber]|uniref:Interleukin-1 receptor-associated kinase-like 2 n=1 Tax=Heterocephalus glaber TaxID=10181 RepID=A0AAX6T689_HETGA|nr:interleukin-1 receptor-associated kinase-like 2 isoform X2 [Heterocephalus glaber]XP_021116319.1 interleukin-1 receptor-associated kinase-like 2 isoform X2 [Heterocephalus glaber]
MLASYVITDLTQLRKIKSMERVQGVSITRELLWWWGMRQATVQQLVDLLRHLELYRAAHIVLSWRQVPGPSSPLPAFPGAVTPGPVAAALRSTEEDRDSREPWGPSIFQSPGSALPRAHQPASLLLPSIEDTAPSIKTDLPSMLDSKDFSTSISKQERLLSCSGNSLLWSEADVVQATSDFGPSHRIIRGTFADVYRGQRHGVLLVIKKLQEGACSSPESLERYLQAEVRVCLRCCHPNVLPLLGFCTGGQFHSLIYPYMANGSLQDRLQGQGGSDPLPWPQLVSICSGLLHAVEHLHILDIIHGNIKSSNVLLDEEFTPKLAHPVAQLYPVHKRSEYTVMKTHLFQASAAYMPEDFIRVGQLTKRVDVFSCGIVLAEVLTGMPAMDNGRSPVYLKDLLLSEITSSRKTGVEKVLAKEICQKYLEKRAWSLPEHCAEALATAVCLCLQRRNTGLQEALGSVAAVEEWLRGRGPLLPWSGLSAGTCSSANTPEESDVVDHAGLDAASSGRAVRGAAAEAEAGGLQADSSGAQSGKRSRRHSVLPC